MLEFSKSYEMFWEIILICTKADLGVNLSSAYQWPWVSSFDSMSLNILKCKRKSWVTFLYVKYEYVYINKCKCLCINKYVNYKIHVNYLLKKQKIAMISVPGANGELQKEIQDIGWAF